MIYIASYCLHQPPSRPTAMPRLSVQWINQGHALRLCAPLILFWVAFASTAFAKSKHDSTLQLGMHLYHAIDTLNGNSCVGCHPLTHPDTFYWSPLAYEISIRYANTNIPALEEALMYPLSDKMFEMHDGYNFSPQQMEALQAYLKSIHSNGPPPLPRNRNNLWYSLLPLILLLLIKFLKYRTKPGFIAIRKLLLAGCLCWFIASFIDDLNLLNHRTGYAPDQPIKFSHKVHTGENQIKCIYCHASYEKSSIAGLPATNICLNCHAVVRAGSHSGEFELRKLFEAEKDSTPLKWIRVANLPAHVYFRHDIHAKSGKVACASCHGPVENMQRIGQIERFSMGWCIDCHKKNMVPLYTNTNQLKTNPFDIDSVSVHNALANDCWACHR